jgi:hypothetical protein
MTAPTALPAPAQNLTAAGVMDRAADVAGTDLVYATGDFTGGAAEDLFTASSHGLTTGNHVHCIWQSAMGVVTGGEGTHAIVTVLSANTFTLTDTDGTAIENTADGTAFFLVGDIPDAVVDIVIVPNFIVAAGDFTGGAAEDIFTPAQGTKGVVDTDQLKLLYESAAGAAGTVNTTYYAVGSTVTYFQVSATSGGAAVANTADGTVAFMRAG